MKLSSWHRSRGDTVHFYAGARAAARGDDEPEYDQVYGSAIFKFSAPLLEKFKAAFPNSLVGGTGTDTTRTVEDLLGPIPDVYDYSIARRFQASIGFTQRGCRLACKFCVVPAKEGKPRSVNTIADIWRGGIWPRHLHLLDNDFFGQPEDAWRARIAEIRDGAFKVSFTQGINVRAMTPAVAEALASVQYRDDSFSRRRLYTAWDNLKDENVFFKGVDLLEAAGIPPTHLMAYMLVGFDKNETPDRLFHRFNRMVARGIRPYPMVYDRSRRDLRQFARWVITGLYRAVPFDQYDPSVKRPRAPREPPMNSRAKGKAGELELAAFLREHGYEEARRGVQYSGGGDSPDVVGVDGLHIECKRTEICKPYDYLDQARRDSADTGRLPVVAFRRNRKEWLGILDFAVLLDVFRFAREHGYEHF